MKSRVLFVYLLLMGSSMSWAQLPVFAPRSAEVGIAPVADIAHFYGHGASAADYDQDGDIDFYLTTTNGVVDRLYQNQGDGQFVDVAAQVGLGIRQATRTALWWDYNGDQRLDLLVLGERCLNFKCGQPILVWLYQQQPDGTFVDVAAQAGLIFGDKYDNIEVYAAGGLAAGDLNGDQWLDLIITVWGGQNSVFLNQGDGTFTDVSLSSGIGQNRKYYWQPMVHDFDGDGRMDIYCNVDFGPNEMWINQGNGRFLERANDLGADPFNSEMGMALGDYDNDGDFDIYATNITRTFNDHKQHNVLLTSEGYDGRLIYYESAEFFKVHESGWDWGTTFFDINNDGWLDLASTNGWNDPSWHPDQSKFWLNTNGTFTEHSTTCKFNDSLSATTLLAFDVDRDGDQDLLQTLKENPNTTQPVIIYENELMPRANSNYLVVKPRMLSPNHWAIGAVVKVQGEGHFGMRLISAGTSFYGQEPAEAFFGLGSRTFVEEVVVEWPDGAISVYPQVAANQVLRLDYEVVAPPLGLEGRVEEGQLTLGWEDTSDNELAFELQRSYTYNFSDPEQFSLDRNQTTWVDSTLDPRHTAYYRIKAIGENFHSAWSATWATNQRVTNLESLPANGFAIFPNPSQGQFYVQWQDDYQGDVKMAIFTLTGQQVYRQTFQKATDELMQSLNLPLEPNIYLVTVQVGDRIHRQKLVVR